METVAHSNLYFDSAWVYTVVIRSFATFVGSYSPAKTYLKECPLSASIANREFPLSSLLEDVMRPDYTHYKLQIAQLHSGLH